MLLRYFTSNPEKFIFTILAVIFFGFGTLFSYLLGQVNTLTCERGDRVDDLTCRLTTSWMNIRTLKVRSIPRLDAAGIEEYCDDDGCTYRVILFSGAGNIPLSSAYTSAESSHRMTAERINTFLQDGSQQTLEVETGGGWILVVPVIFAVLGLFFSWKTFRQ